MIENCVAAIEPCVFRCVALAAHFFVGRDFMAKGELIYRIDGYQGKELLVYGDRCEILPSPILGKEQGRKVVFSYSGLERVEFRNLSFFLCGYIRFISRGEARFGSQPTDDWFFFTSFSKPVNERLAAQMPEVFRYISDKVYEANQVST